LTTSAGVRTASDTTVPTAPARPETRAEESCALPPERAGLGRWLLIEKYAGEQGGSNGTKISGIGFVFSELWVVR
jgi:hypothetical protein